MPSLLILIPLFGIIILNLPLGSLFRRLAFWFAIALFVIQIILAVFHHPVFWSGDVERTDYLFNMNFSVDHLGFIMFLCIGIVSLASLAVARYTISDEKGMFRFINLLIITSIGMSGIVLAKDIFSLYVFLEVTAISSFILIAFDKGASALEGAFKYMLLSAIATVLMISAIALLLLISSGTSFSAIHEALEQTNLNYITMIAIGMFICGLLIKGALVPFHGWLPDAYMAAPAPVSVLLAGIVTKTAGIYTLIRVVTVSFGFTEPLKNILMFIGTASILIGAFAAIGQDDFKRMLAYSSISQVGYIVLGLGSGTGLGIAGAAFHLFNHAIFKSLLFVNSASVERRLGTNDMNRMSGLSVKMPFTGATSVVGLLSASGIPPLAGFWSKIIIIIALWQANYPIYAVIAILASIVTLAYFLTMQRRVFFGKLMEGLEGLKEADAGIVFVSCALAIIAIGTGVFFPVVFNTFILPIMLSK